MPQENIFPYTVSLGGFLFERDAAGVLHANGAPVANLTAERLTAMFDWSNQVRHTSVAVDANQNTSAIADVIGCLYILRDKKRDLIRNNTLLGELFQIKVTLAIASGVLGNKDSMVYQAFDYMRISSVEPDTEVEESFKLVNSSADKFATVSQEEPSNPKKELLFQFAGLWVKGGPCDDIARSQFIRDYQCLIAERPELAAAPDQRSTVAEGVPVMHPETKAKVREIFLESGFTIKEGEADLKDYVYDAAAKLLAWGKYSGV